MDKNKLEELISHLQYLADGGVPDETCSGICTEVDKIFGDDAKKLIVEYFHLWDEFSGCSIYPVPHPFFDAFDAFDAFMSIENLWIREYGDSRRRLCGFLAKKIREDFQLIVVREDLA